MLASTRAPDNSASGLPAGKAEVSGTQAPCFRQASGNLSKPWPSSEALHWPLGRTGIVEASPDSTSHCPHSTGTLRHRASKRALRCSPGQAERPAGARWRRPATPHPPPWKSPSRRSLTSPPQLTGPSTPASLPCSPARLASVGHGAATRWRRSIFAALLVASSAATASETDWLNAGELREGSKQSAHVARMYRPSSPRTRICQEGGG